MSANCDSTTGVAYGVLQGNHVPELDQEIFEKGTDQTYKAWRAQLMVELQDALDDLDIPEYREDDEETRREAMEDILQEAITGLDIMRPLEVFQACRDCIDVAQGLFDVDAIFEYLVDHESQYYQCDEPKHTWRDGDTFYIRDHLGGAVLIWVTKSRYVTPCRTCSPCVPGAGNLDSACEPGGANNLAYCPKPEDWVDEMEEDRKPYVIYKTDENGYPTKEVAWQRS